MSGNSEHSPDDTETETKVMEDLPNDSSKSEAKLMMNQTDAAMLEDEEMPTYISVSSTTKPDDSDVVNVKQSENKSQEMEEDRSPSPYPSDDQAASSVYVLSSEEETDQHPYNDEDDEDEYGDSDDMENLELDNEFDSDHPSNMKHLMDDEDDDDDDEDEDEEDDEDSPRQMHNDDDGIDDNYEIDCYDGRSDDFILNRRLKNRDKEKSLSLQDLNMYKNNVNVEHFKRRHSQGLRLNYQNIPEHAIMYSVMQRKQQSMPRKYHYVQSKVKRYIKDIKEQNRRSMEKHVKQHQKDTIYSKSNTDHKNNDIEKIKPTVTNKTIKDYAERTIKELEIAETCDSSMNKVAYNATTSPITLNGQDNKNCLELVHEESIRNEVQITVPFESTQNERDLVSTDNKIQKQNGTIEIKQLNYSDRETPHFGDALQPSLIQNGHQEAPTVLYNLRTLSYEEYMHGTSDSNQKTDLNKNEHVETIEEQIQPETYNSDLMDISTDNEDACPLRIENIKSIKTMSDETKNNNEQITCEKTNEEFNKTNFDTSEVTTLKKKLTQKTVKYNSLLDTYQKQLMENLKMKQELDELRKTLAKYEKEKKPPEQKVASIQTDIDFVPNQHQDPTEPTHVKQSNNKVSPVEGSHYVQFGISITVGSSCDRIMSIWTSGSLWDILRIKCAVWDWTCGSLWDILRISAVWTEYLYDFLDALITQQTSPEEAYRKFDDLANKHTEALRKATKQVQEARLNHDDNAVKKAVNDYEEALDRYVPVLMAQAKIYWDLENYTQVEKIFKKSVEFCNEHDVWKLNVAHTLFMQENKFKDATRFYEPIVKKKYDNILDVSAIVLANLCVSYIMTSQNAEAEELMKKIEKEEEAISFEDQDKKLFHLCIVNLVIGTLYCSKGNYEFGISRVMKSLEPYNKKLGTDTWFYAKRCFLSLLEQLAKQLVVLKDSTLQECVQFLEHCEVYGKDIMTVIDQPFDIQDMLNVSPQSKRTVVYEARYLKALFLKLQMS